jgi:hypothetical protein
MRSMKSLGTFVLATLLVGGCATGPVYLRAYAGEEVPPSQLALLKPASGIRILSLDGDKSKAVSPSQSFGNTNYEIGLLPGAHAVLVSYNSGNAYSTSTMSRAFNVAAGRRYLLRANVVKSPLSWNPAVVDVTERPECWTVLADTLFGSCN